MWQQVYVGPALPLEVLYFVGSDIISLVMILSRRMGMRSFVIACIAAVVIASIGAISLNFVQEPVNVAFATESVRL
jgi:hypothetical protein